MLFKESNFLIIKIHAHKCNLSRKISCAVISAIDSFLIRRRLHWFSQVKEQVGETIKQGWHHKDVSLWALNKLIYFSWQNRWHKICDLNKCLFFNIRPYNNVLMLTNKQIMNIVSIYFPVSYSMMDMVDYLSERNMKDYHTYCNFEYLFLEDNTCKIIWYIDIKLWQKHKKELCL